MAVNRDLLLLVAAELMPQETSHLPDLVDPDRQFALLHAGVDADLFAAVWAFDETLGRIVANARELFVGQMRLTWWHEAVSKLGEGTRRGEPVLDALARLPGLDMTALASVVEGWEALLEQLPIDDPALLAYAKGRGGGSFNVAASSASSVIVTVGEGWALADFAKRCSDPETATRAWELAAARLATVRGGVPGGVPRPLRILARLAWADVQVRGHADRTRWRLLRATW